MMIRKAITDRLKPLAAMCSTIQTCGTRIVDRLAGRPAAPAGAASSYRLILEHMHAELLALESRLEVAEAAQVAGQHELDKCKHRRDQAQSNLEHLYRDVKGFLTGFFQPHDLVSLGVTGAIPRSPFVLCHRVTSTAGSLRRLDTTVTPPILEVNFDADAMAGELEAGAGELEAAAIGLQAARLAIDRSRDKTRDAAAAVDRVGPWIARLLECLGHLAEDPGMTRRVKTR